MLSFYTWARHSEYLFDAKNHSKLSHIITRSSAVDKKQEDSKFDFANEQDRSTSTGVRILVDGHNREENATGTDEDDTPAIPDETLWLSVPEGQLELPRISTMAIFHKTSDGRGVPHAFYSFLRRWPALPRVVVRLLRATLAILSSLSDSSSVSSFPDLPLDSSRRTSSRSARRSIRHRQGQIIGRVSYLSSCCLSTSPLSRRYPRPQAFDRTDASSSLSSCLSLLSFYGITVRLGYRDSRPAYVEEILPRLRAIEAAYDPKQAAVHIQDINDAARNSTHMFVSSSLFFPFLVPNSAR